METIFRIEYSHPQSLELEDYTSLLKRVGEMLCQECGGACREFFLSEDASKYQACHGPKIGWAIEGEMLVL